VPCITHNYRQARAIFEEKDWKFRLVAKPGGKSMNGKHITSSQMDKPLPIDCKFFEIMLYTDDDPDPMMPTDQ